MVTCGGPLGLQLPFPLTPIWAVKSKGLEGAVDMDPRRIDSSNDPTMDAFCKGEESEYDVLRDRRCPGEWGEVET